VYAFDEDNVQLHAENFLLEFGQEILHPLYNIMFHYHINNSPPLDTTVLQLITVYTFTVHMSKIHFNIVLLSVQKFKKKTVLNFTC